MREINHNIATRTGSGCSPSPPLPLGLSAGLVFAGGMEVTKMEVTVLGRQTGSDRTGAGTAAGSDGVSSAGARGGNPVRTPMSRSCARLENMDVRDGVSCGKRVSWRRRKGGEAGVREVREGASECVSERVSECAESALELGWKWRSKRDRG
eukprot:517261-Prorocentrum_minimum.AAC.2